MHRGTNHAGLGREQMPGKSSEDDSVDHVTANEHLCHLIARSLIRKDKFQSKEDVGLDQGG